MNLDELHAAARQLPFREPPPAVSAALRASLVEAALTRPPRRRRPARAAAALVVLAAAGLALWATVGDPPIAAETALPASPGPLRARVEASTGAEVEHAREVDTDGGAVEVLHVREGRVAVHVDRLAASERLRVRAGDAEVVVMAASFAASLEVVVAEHHLIEISLKTGQAELHLPGNPPVELRPGRPWRAPDRTPAPAMNLAPRVDPRPPGPARRAATIARDAPARRPATGVDPDERAQPIEGASPAPARMPSAAELAFTDGFRALRAGDYDGAAAHFARAAGDPLAADARYWRAVALGRAGRSSEARRAFDDFLQRHPTSPRAAAASVMLGWLLLEAGDRDGAARRFRTATGDRHPEIRTSAEKGLAAARRASPSDR